MENSVKRVKYACYATNVTMAIVCNLSPLLFIIFRTAYGISYSLLGLLVLIGFCTQLTIDLIFSFFSHKFNLNKTVKITPLLATFGLVIYAVLPIFLRANAYIGLVIGTIIFSASSGFAEVLISPVIAQIPAKDPDREMSKLHSIYAWGVVGIVGFSTLFLFIFGSESWSVLTLILTIVPVLATILFAGAKIPDLPKPEKISGTISFIKNKAVWLCVFAIFLGGASELVMGQWSSSYLETALGLPKIYGDIFGVMLFALTQGIGRTLYAKIGKNIYRVLILGAIGAFICYLTAAVTPLPIIGLIACALTGFCIAMMWPGSLIVSSEKFPNGGVLMFALMAAGGDLGASVGPQLVGVITDVTIASSFASGLASNLGITVEQLGMKAGMLIGSIFPLLAILVFTLLFIKRNNKNTLSNEKDC